MSGNSKPTQNDALSFEQRLDKAERLDRGAFGGPWAWGLDSADRIIMTTHGAVPFTLIEGDDFRGATEEAEWIAHARTALPAAVAALRAVADLHQPDDGGHCTECLIGHDGDSFTAGNPVYDAWPCATITAIQDTLGDHQ